jgi:hypothetical protein
VDSKRRPKSKSFIISPDDMVVSLSSVRYNKDVPRRVKIRSLLDARLKITGPVSGEQYEFVGAGVEVEILETDVPLMLAKRVGGRGCCGADAEGNKLFELA